MNHQIQAFRAQSLAYFEQERANIDAVLLPFLDRINALPFVLSNQACAGHMWYTENGKQSGKPFSSKFRPRKSTGRWGYLSLDLTQEAAKHLHEKVWDGTWTWVWNNGSQLFIKGATEPSLIDGVDGWGRITFAWDAKHWPRPVLDITEALEAF